MVVTKEVVDAISKAVTQIECSKCKAFQQLAEKQAIKMLKEKIEELKQKIKEKNEEIERLKQEKRELRKKLALLREENSKLKKQVNLFLERNKELRRKLASTISSKNYWKERALKAEGRWYHAGRNNL